MNEKTSAALARRLAAYSATAGVSLALAPAVGAQVTPTDPDRLITGSDVVYYDLDPDPVLRSPSYGTTTYYFDFDSDGVDDLWLVACYSYGDCPYYLRGGHYRIAFGLPDGAPTINGVYGDNEFASRLSSGDLIGGPPAPGRGFYTFALAAFDGYSGAGGPFLGEQGYAGFRFIAGDGQLHYGWIRLRASGDATRAKVFEYGYESMPETPIAAGDTGTHAPAVTLDATVNRTTFPPEGGTLTFTATATNTTDEPEALDLWAVARGPGGDLLGVRRLRSTTVPAGATVSVRASTMIQAVAPAGTGEVKLHVGRYPRVIDSEVFEITKEGAAPANGTEGSFFAGDEQFVEEAQAEAATAVPGTHTLTAPSPNPTTGRAEVSIAVAETQDVSVAVYDALGRRVALLHDGPLSAGAAHWLVFDGSALPAGVYVVRAVGEAFADARVLTLTP